MSFGEYLKQLRFEKGQSLRSFCLEHKLDPGNYSKMERDVLSPPKDEARLKDLAFSFGLKDGTKAWRTFFDLAIIYSGKIPDYIMSDAEVLNKLPLLFRTLKGEKVGSEKLQKLVEIIKES